MAGFTTVSATVLDPGGIPYANGTWTANFVDPGTPGKTPLINNSIITNVYAGDMDSFGAFTVSLPDNNVIGSQTGAVGTQWKFTFAAKSSPVGLGAPPAFSVGPLTITGATQNISSTVQSAAASLAPLNTAVLSANNTFTGNNTFNTGTTTISGPSSIASPSVTGTVAGGAIYIAPTLTSPTTTGTDNGTETLVNKTLTSPVINGTPTGTGTPTIVFARGSGGGNYTTSNAAYQDIDAANLTSGSLTVPTGWKAVITLNVFGNAATSSTASGFAIADGTTVLIENTSSAADSVNKTILLRYTFTGDGAAHTFKARFKGDGTHLASVVNLTSTERPTLDVFMTPSN